MRLALINPPYPQLVLRCGYCSSFSKSDYYWPPLDIIIQSGFLHQAGHEVRAFDFNVRGTGFEDALNEVVAFAPQGIFLLAGSGSWKSDMAFAVGLKERLPDAKVLAGGAPLLYNPAEFLKIYHALDGVLMDFTQDVLGSFFEGKKNVLNISVRAGDEVEIAMPSTDKTFSHPPGRHELLPLELYSHPWKSCPYSVILTSFGCPFSCTFCNTSSVPFKYRPIEEVIAELKYINSIGIGEVMFRDLNFVNDRKKTRKLCRNMIDNGIEMGWYACVRADSLDEETLSLMKAAGCHTLHIGVESGSESILRHYQKNVNLEKIRNSFSLCRKIGIKTLAFFIIGLPGETPESIRQTIEFSKSLKCNFASFNIAMPLYGTKLREECVSEGYVESVTGLEELETSYHDVTIETPLITKKQIHEGHSRAMREFYLRPGYLLGLLLSIRNIDDARILFRMGMPVLKKILFKQ